MIHERRFGALVLRMQRTVDGGYAFNVFIGGHSRFSPLCLATFDRAQVVARWNAVRDLALVDTPAERIAAIVFATQ